VQYVYDAAEGNAVLKEQKRNTNLGVGFGWLALSVGTTMIRSQSSAAAVLGSIVWLLGAGLFIWGCTQYAQGKGHSGYWGAFGLLWILGLVVLVFLPDRNKE
jgi:hypothetical protein